MKNQKGSLKSTIAVSLTNYLDVGAIVAGAWGLGFVYIYGEHGEGFYRAAYIMIALLMASMLIGTIWTPKTRGKSLDQITKERYGDNI